MTRSWQTLAIVNAITMTAGKVDGIIALQAALEVYLLMCLWRAEKREQANR